MESDVRLRPGTVFARDFRVLRPLSDGGMGEVYVVEQLSTAKERALKIMHPRLVQDPRSRARFAQEARVGAHIKSDHVVEVVGAGVDEATGTPWLAMELLEGEDLASMARTRGQVPPAQLLAIYRQLGHALAAAHRAGIIHRDLKPENIFVSTVHREGASFMVKILDFGIAKMAQESRAATLATGPIGTPLWMAPEQVDASSKIAPATDVWALGLIAFFLLTARHYWKSASGGSVNLQGLLCEIMVDPFDAASARAALLGSPYALPPGFDAWFARCVAREPTARFQDAGAMLAALVPVLDDPRATPSTPPLYAVQPALAYQPTVTLAPPPSQNPFAPVAPPPPPGPLAAPASGRPVGLLLGLAAVVGICVLVGSAWLAFGHDASTRGASTSSSPPPSPSPPDPGLQPLPTPPPNDLIVQQMAFQQRRFASEMQPVMPLARGTLGTGGRQTWTVTMQPDRCYKIIGVGGAGVVDLDLFLHDPAGTLIDQDVATDNYPVIGLLRPLCPAFAGTYRLDVRMYAGAGEYGVQVFGGDDQ